MWLLALALADDDVDLEVVVEEQLSAEELRVVLDDTILDQGDRDGARRDGHTVYRPEAWWNPVLRVYDSGIVTAKHNPVAVARAALFGELRILKNAEGRVVTSIHPDLFEWNEGISREAMDLRYQMLFEAFEALWERGEPLMGRAPVLTVAERREQLLAFWATRTDTPEGEIVRGLVVDFLEAVVQTSEHPLTGAEIEEAEERAGRVLGL